MNEIPPIGEATTAKLVDGLTRTQIVQYAGASGDFNPLHTDEVFALGSAGLPTVLAHGMLTMGLVGTVLCDLVDQDRVRTFGGRFKKPVVPGDTLTVEIVPAAGTRPEEVDLALVVHNQSGDEVFAGYASVVAVSSSTP